MIPSTSPRKKINALSVIAVIVIGVIVFAASLGKICYP